VLDASAADLPRDPARRRRWAKHGMLVACSSNRARMVRGRAAADIPRWTRKYGWASRSSRQAAQGPAVLAVLPGQHGLEEAVVAEKSFGENYRYSVLLEPQSLPLVATDLLLPPGMANKACSSMCRCGRQSSAYAIARLPFENEYFQRVLLEPLA